MHVGCGECGAGLEVGDAERTAHCPYCGSPNVIAKPAPVDRPTPSLVAPFVLPRERALATARKWVKGAWLAPNAFRRANVDEVRGVYVPTYLYTAVAHTHYTAEIGENYTETRTVTRNGKQVTERVTRTEWRPLAGDHSAYVSDVVVTASKAIANAELAAIEPYRLDAVRRFSPKLVSGWIVEDPTLVPAEVVEMARAEAQAETAKRIGRFMPGDSHRSLALQCRLDLEALDAILLPTYVLPVRYDATKPPVRLLVNGQTGKLQGNAPVSAAKVAAIVIATLLAIAGAMLLLWLGR